MCRAGRRGGAIASDSESLDKVQRGRSLRHRRRRAESDPAPVTVACGLTRKASAAGSLTVIKF